jgi:hypothetical protein
VVSPLDPLVLAGLGRILGPKIIPVNCLVVLTILKHMKVNGKDDIPYIMENMKND